MIDQTLATAPLWSYGITAACYLVFAMQTLRMQRRGQRDRINILLSLAALATVLWAIEGLLWALKPISLFAATHFIFDSIRYGTWYGFLITLLGSARLANGPNTPIQARWPYFVGGCLVAIGILLQVLVLAGTGLSSNLARGISYAAISQSIFGLVLMEQLFRNTTADSRWVIKPLGIALAAIFGYDLYFHSLNLLFNQVDIDTFIVRGIANALVLPLIVLTLYRTRSRQLRIAISQTAAFQTTSLLIAGTYLLIAATAGYYVRYLGGSWGGALQVAVLFASLLVLMVFMLSGTMRARLKILVGKHFFRYRYDYREEWLKFTKTLSAGEGAHLVGQQVIRGLADMVESPAGSLWLRAPEGGHYNQIAYWNQPACQEKEPANSSLLTFLNTSGWVVDLQEYRYQPGRYHDLTLPDWLTATPNAWLIVPLSLSSGIVGFVVLATSRAPLDTNWEVNDLLRTAGRQAATFLSQALATEALLDARKFDAFNKMSAFVVHDLKNIITQLSLMLRNAERHADNPEFQRDMLETVRHSVDRMRQLMMQLREGSTPADGACGVNLEAIAQKVRQSKLQQSPPVEIRIREAVVARGHSERIERVIGHLVQNALEATPAEGRVWVDIGREGSMATVEVGDCGHGMSAEFVRERLFKPFQTTKSAGMGIGAYESRQYIQELGGDIRVESIENSGTRFFIRIPLIEVSQSSDLKQMENP